MQQYLPFTVLKLQENNGHHQYELHVATVLTVYGIETNLRPYLDVHILLVATVLTVYGIETIDDPQDVEDSMCCNSTYRLRY